MIAEKQLLDIDAGDNPDKRATDAIDIKVFLCESPASGDLFLSELWLFNLHEIQPNILPHLAHSFLSEYPAQRTFRLPHSGHICPFILLRVLRDGRRENQTIRPMTTIMRSIISQGT